MGAVGGDTAPGFYKFLHHDAFEEIMFEGLFQPMHLILIGGIALLIFGPKKLPELGKGLGESIRGFKSAMAAKDEVGAPQKSEQSTNVPKADVPKQS
jgi:sec-independent protein translocase protein TatA